MHVKWWKAGTLVTEGAMGLKGQLGGGIAGAAICALTSKQFM